MNEAAKKLAAQEAAEASQKRGCGGDKVATSPDESAHKKARSDNEDNDEESVDVADGLARVNMTH